MDISAPSWKKPMPKISSTAPVRNSASVPISIGTSVMLSTSTISVIGRTLERDSFTFSFSFSFIRLRWSSFRGGSGSLHDRIAVRQVRLRMAMNSSPVMVSFS